MNLLVIHGPNINLTGLREKGQYGSESLDDINAHLMEKAAELGITLKIMQTNFEGGIIEAIHASREGCDGIILNAGAFTHYSYAIRDAIAAVDTPCVEVHFSNIAAREEFRHRSVIAPVCKGSVAGFGKHSYMMAMHYFVMNKQED